MAQHQAMMDAIRDGVVNPARATCPDDPAKRADHLKAFAYFNDASLVGCTRLPEEARLDAPRRNPGIDALAQDLRTRQTKTLASGIDLIMADLRESVSAPASSIAQHTHALVIVQDAPRAMAEGEPGADVLVCRVRRSWAKASIPGLRRGASSRASSGSRVHPTKDASLK
ncbi:MAG: hypothetical protein AAFQ50_17410 [Pseudomonadota bacterium]